MGSGTNNISFPEYFVFLGMSDECAYQHVKNLLQKLTSEDSEEQRVTAYCDEIDEITNNIADLDDKRKIARE